jgi:hypothetical protein
MGEMIFLLPLAFQFGILEESPVKGAAIHHIMPDTLTL